MINTQPAATAAFTSSVLKDEDLLTPCLGDPTVVLTTVPRDEIAAEPTPEEEAALEQRLLSIVKKLKSNYSARGELIEVYTQLGRLYVVAERYERAMRVLLEALELSQSTYGKEHPNCADIFVELGFIQFKKGQYEFARTYLTPALSIYEENYGKVSDPVALVLHKLGRACEALGDLASAEANYQRSVTILQNTFNEDDSQILIARNDLARVRAAQQ